jgi:TetR/AcrR family transcriptional regulator, transcriptional repressor for nem operon
MALRDPDKTRSKILTVAANIFHQKGYNCTSLSDILSAAEVSKGALYHHFSNKEELLYSVVEEVYQEQFLARWKGILNEPDPLEAMAIVVESNSGNVTAETMCSGCPIYNIAGELSALNDGLRLRVDAIFRNLFDIIRGAIELAQRSNIVNSGVDSERVSLLILSSLNGMPQIVKSCLDKNMFQQLNSALADYIRSFKQSN